jgi:D-alanyl-D-alanine carboxypeptidase
MSVLLALAVLVLAPATPAQAKYASILINAETGEVLHAVNPDVQNYPASLAKMMTLYMVFDAIKGGRVTMDTKIKISRRAARQPASKLDLKPNEKITIRDAVMGLVVKSANDAAAAVSEALGGSERNFARMMTRKAESLGMTKTLFRNASGLPHRSQLTTARDLARLVHALQRDFPERYKLFSTRSFTYKGQRHENHNRMLDRYVGTDGVKTGYIRASGFNLATSAKRADVRLIGVVMGTRSPRVRDLHMMGLLERGFEKATKGIYAAYDYDRNLRISRSKRRVAQRIKVKRAPGARGRIRLARLTPPRRPAALAPVVGVGSAQADVETAALTPESEKPWGIQVGAFTRFAPAHLAANRAIRLAPGELLRTRVRIVPVRQGPHTLYRAQLLGLNESSAQAACGMLAGKGFACATVAPDGTVKRTDNPG